MKKFLIILIGITIAINAYAVDIQPIKIKDSLFDKIFSKISYCGFNPFCYFQQNFGVTITTITGTETVSYALKTTTNNNFTALNNGKVENATTSMSSITTLSNLATIGTITSGSWNATAIPVSKGGTGTTSPSIYQVILGNGANGLTVASSTGASGQFLTSNGAGAYPSWTTSALDQSLSYNWTGSVFNVKNLYASSTAANPLRLNGVSYAFPSAISASSTQLMTDASGNVKWMKPYRLLSTSSCTNVNSGSYDYQYCNLGSFTLPAGVIGTDGLLKIDIGISDFDAVNGGYTDVALVIGNATTSFIDTRPNNQPVLVQNQTGKISFSIMGNGATNSQWVQTTMSVGSTTIASSSLSSIDTTVANTLKFNLGSQPNTTMTLKGLIGVEQ